MAKLGQEIHIPSYYQNLRDSNFIDTNLCCRLGMEFFLSWLLFKGDTKRVLYSKEDIAFRRRIETIGKGDVKNQDYNYVNLDLPYAIYSQTGTYEPDDRGATQQAGQIVLGQVQIDSGLIIKAAAVKIKYSATAFFSRRDDINVASQLLYWESQPKFPVYYIVQHEVAGWPIDIPVFMTLESFDMNTDYNEKDWLNKSKIFPIKIEFVIRSYQTLIENIDEVIPLPIRFSGLYGYNDEKVVLTHNSVLEWADDKWPAKKAVEWVDSFGKKIHVPQEFNINWRDPAVADMKAHFDYMGHTPTSDKIFNTHEVVADAIKGYFDENRDCTLDEFHQLMDETTENEIKVEWHVKDSDLENFEKIVLYIPGLFREELIDPTEQSFVFKGLYPGSEYDLTLIVYSKEHNKLSYKLNLKTAGEPVLGNKLSDSLVGKVFQVNTFNKFTGREDEN